MEKKLEIKHLAAYHPHKLWVENMNFRCDYTGVQYSELTWLYPIVTDKEYIWCYKTTAGNADNIEECRPILRPLDLTKEIAHKGETFVPIVELAKEFHIVSEYTVTSYRDAKDYKEYGSEVKCCVENDESRYSYFRIHGGEMIHHSEYRIVQKLHEWMFDTENLIESGLAINVNTLEANPYEI